MGGDRGTLHQLLWWLSTRKPPKSRVKEMGRHLKVSNSDNPVALLVSSFIWKHIFQIEWDLALETEVLENPSVGKGIKRLNP